MNRSRVQEQLAIDEGVVYAIYLDHLSHPTFGIGHLILKKDKEYGLAVGTSVSQDRVTEVFQLDLDNAISDCRILYSMWETFPSEVQEVLVNMMFNLGRTRLSKFKNFKKALDAHDWKQAAIDGKDSKWYNQVGNRAERLMTRLKYV
jgi:lysozyme